MVKEEEIVTRSKKGILKVGESMTTTVTKKRGKYKRRKNDCDFLRSQSRQSSLTSIWLQLAGVLSDTHSLSLSLVREDVFFCLLFSYIYEVVGDLRALGITAFYCLNVDHLALCA